MCTNGKNFPSDSITDWRSLPAKWSRNKFQRYRKVIWGSMFTTISKLILQLFGLANYDTKYHGYNEN